MHSIFESTICLQKVFDAELTSFIEKITTGCEAVPKPAAG